MTPAFQTHEFTVVTRSQWDEIVNTYPHHYQGSKPYNAHPYSIFDGRYVVVVETIGM